MAEHRAVAAAHDWVVAAGGPRGLTARRQSLSATAHGRVLEIGAGAGDTHHFPPDEVTSIVVLEPDGGMRRRLAARAPGPTALLRVEAATIEEADFAEGSFDTVVACLVLCRVRDPDQAAAALYRWLAPGGRFLFVEHVRAYGPLSQVQRFVAPAWSRLTAGCRLDRDTLSSLRGAGLVVTDCERFALPGAGPLFRSSVQGVAYRRPIGLYSWQ